MTDHSNELDDENSRRLIEIAESYQRRRKLRTARKALNFGASENNQGLSNIENIMSELNDADCKRAVEKYEFDAKKGEPIPNPKNWTYEVGDETNTPEFYRRPPHPSSHRAIFRPIQADPAAVAPAGTCQAPVTTCGVLMPNTKSAFYAPTPSRTLQSNIAQLTPSCASSTVPYTDVTSQSVQERSHVVRTLFPATASSALNVCVDCDTNENMAHKPLTPRSPRVTEALEIHSKGLKQDYIENGAKNVEQATSSNGKHVETDFTPNCAIIKSDSSANEADPDSSTVHTSNSIAVASTSISQSEAGSNVIMTSLQEQEERKRPLQQTLVTDTFRAKKPRLDEASRSKDDESA